MFPDWLLFHKDKDTRVTRFFATESKGPNLHSYINTIHCDLIRKNRWKYAKIGDFLTLRASVSSFRIVLVSLFPFSARVSRCGRAASVGRSRRNASSVSSVKPSSKLTTVDAWRCRCIHRRSMSRAVSGIPDRSNAPLDRGADSTAFKLQMDTWANIRINVVGSSSCILQAFYLKFS